MLTSEITHTPIDRFAVKYGMEMDLARCLVGHTEAETERNIALWSAYLDNLRPRTVNKFDISKQLSEWIVDRSVERGKRVTQRDIAKAVGVSEWTVCYWRTGDHKAKMLWIEKLADYFGLTVNEFLEGPESEC